MADQYYISLADENVRSVNALVNKVAVALLAQGMDPKRISEINRAIRKAGTVVKAIPVLFANGVAVY